VEETMPSVAYKGCPWAIPFPQCPMGMILIKWHSEGAQRAKNPEGVAQPHQVLRLRLRMTGLGWLV